jgi:hypothetical protein
MTEASEQFSIFAAMGHPDLWQAWFRDTRSWRNWKIFLAVLFGRPLNEFDIELYRHCTGRTTPSLDGYREAWLVCGRRAGKSFILALIACFLAIFRDWKPYLAPGEVGTIKIIATDKKQVKVIYKYCRALLMDVPTLEELVIRETEEQIELNNGIVIEIQSASFRAVRGFTLITALCDELAFWRNDEGSANPDSEIIAALRAMATIPGAFFLAASSPYSRRGELWRAYKEHWGAEDSNVLVWKAATRTMNQMVPQSLVDAALAEDPAKASAEFLAEFRSDIESFVDREVVEAAVITGRYELAPASGVNYVAFVDPSGAAVDAMTLAIAHKEGDNVILDAVRERRPKFSSESVVAEFCGTLAGYQITEIVGDRFGGQWVVEQFGKHGIAYTTSERAKNALYAEFLPALNSGRVELLDHGRLISELCALERRTGRDTGRDVIDHPPGAHDDLANATAGAVVMALQSAAGATVIPAAALARAREATAYGRSNRYGRLAPSSSVYGVPFSVSMTDLSGH